MKNSGAKASEKIPNGEYPRGVDEHSTPRRVFWYWLGGLAALTAWLLTARIFFVLGSDVTTRTSANLSGSVVRADQADAELQEILTLTALLKQNMDLVFEQRKEILQLRAGLHSEATLSHPPEASPLFPSNSNSSQNVRENVDSSSSSEPRPPPSQH